MQRYFITGTTRISINEVQIFYDSLSIQNAEDVQMDAKIKYEQYGRRNETTT